MESFTVKIGHLTYLVEYTDAHAMKSGNLYGHCNHEKQTILISKGLTDERNAETLLHELMHAVFDVFGISANDNEGRTVTQMATGITQVMKDNPVLRKHLERMWSTQ